MMSYADLRRNDDTNRKDHGMKNRLLGWALLSLCTWLPCGWAYAGDAPSGRPNVLFIAIDDLNHWVGYTGRNSQAKTPNIDRLSQRGVSFTRAYCAAPLCNPSRAALMSGQRPSTSGCYLNDDFWRDYVPKGVGLPAQFRRAGYFVAGAGKIYHGSDYYPSEWDDYYREGKGKRRGAEEDGQSTPGKGVTKLEGFHEPVSHDLRDEDLADWHITNYCIEQLGRPHDRPFFLACGLHKPHLPWVVPLKYYALFPEETIQLPPYKEDDLLDLPAAGVRMANEKQDHLKILASGRWKAAIQAYLACIAYTDMNVGRLLDALDKSPYRRNTIICFWGDHGWHLGEKHHWRKFSLWEEAARAPFIWVVPGLTPPGQRCERTVDFMCIYPTLCELTGIPVPPHVEGLSIRKLLADPRAAWTTPGVTTYGYMNHTVRTEAYRYIRYRDGGEEFYDEQQDPYEWDNRAAGAQFYQAKRELAHWLPARNQPTGKGDGEDDARRGKRQKKQKQ